MRCRSCGTEIAEKALVCFRCGAATAEPTFKPSKPSGGRRALLTLNRLTMGLALVLTVLLTLLIGRPLYSEMPAPPHLRWAAVVVAAAIVGVRAYARRRR